MEQIPTLPQDIAVVWTVGYALSSRRNRTKGRTILHGVSKQTEIINASKQVWV